MDIVHFIYSLSFFILAAILVSRHRSIEATQRKWLIGFAISGGCREFLVLTALGCSPTPLLSWFVITLGSLAYIFLLYSGFSGLGERCRKLAIRLTFIPAAGLLILGLKYGADGLIAAHRYFIALPGVVLTARSLLLASQDHDISNRRRLRITAVAFLLFGFMEGILVPATSFFPASQINLGAFSAILGFPGEIISLILLGAVAFGLGTIRPYGNKEPFNWRRFALTTGLLLSLITAGWISAGILGHTAEDQMRLHSVSQANAIARTIDPRRAKDLQFASSDRTNPSYIQLCKQMRVYAKNMSYRSVYSIALRNNHFVFGPEIFDPGDPLASPPGAVYNKPPEELHQIYSTGIATTAGPYTDEYGTFVSAFAPVIDWRTGNVIMLIGMDFPIAGWRQKIENQRFIPIAITLALILVLLAGNVILARRQQMPAKYRKSYRYTEAVMVAVIGLTITVGAALFVHTSVSYSYHKALSQLADAETGSLIQALQAIRDDQLPGLARFIKSNEAIDHETFRNFALPMAQSAAVQAWEWVPSVRDSDLEGFESKTRREAGFDRFRVFSLSHEPVADMNTPLTEHHPVLYAEPLSGNEAAIGLDLSSESSRHHALTDAQVDRLPTMTDALTLIQGNSSQQGALVCYPVYANTSDAPTEPRDGPRLRGHVVAALRFESLLRTSLNRAGRNLESADVSLWQLVDGGKPRLLATSASNAAAISGSPDENSEQKIVVPFFAFDKTYAITVNPGASFEIGNAQWSEIGMLLAGLLITATLTVFIGSQSNRHLLLELQVHARSSELREREQFIRNVIDSAMDSIVAFDKDLKYVLWNKQLEAVTDIPAHRVLGKQAFGPDAPVPTPISEEVILRVLSGETVVLPDLYVVVPDNGKTAWVSAVYSPQISSSGDIIGVIGVIRDITERKKAEDALRESEGLQRSLLSTLPVAVTVVDPKTRIIERANDHAVILSGVSIDNLVGRRCHQLICPAPDNACPVCDLNKDIDHSEREMLCADGSRLPILKTVKRIILNGQEKLLECFIDLSERKKAEELLIESQERLNQLISAAQDAIIMSDFQGNISLWNDSAARIFGYSKTEALGQNLHALLAPASYPPSCEEGVKTFWETGKGAAVGQTLELSAVRKDGCEFPVELSLAPLRIKGKWHAVGIMRDITDRKNAEQELRLANHRLEEAISRSSQLAEQAEQANQSKSAFLANMSHEIRTPMNGIIGMTKLLMKSSLPPEQHRFAELACSSAESLLAIINDILDFSKIEAHKLELEHVDFDLEAILSETSEILSVIAHTKNLDFKYQIDSNVLPFLNGDPTRLRQILLNLGGNAVKFTSRGEISIHVIQDYDFDHEIRLRFFVRDTGIGIPEDRVASLFSPFTQLDSSTSRKYGGTGLGLAISKELCELMGGAIGVESKEGLGSTFWFTAVFGRAQDSYAGRILPKKDTQNSSLTGLAEGSAQIRILLADDNDTNRMLMVAILEQLGLEAEAVTNGREVLDALARYDYNLILMDCQMPEMDGFESSRRIRQGEAGEQNKTLPIIALTAFATGKDRQSCLDAGMNDYLTKPIHPETLEKTIRRWTHGSSAPIAVSVKDSDKKAPAIIIPSGIPKDPSAQKVVKAFDRDSLLRRIGNNIALACKLKDAFLSDMPVQIDYLKTAMAKGDVQEISRLAHRIKGAAANMSCEAFRAVAQSLEKSATEVSSTAIAGMVADLEREFQITSQEISAAITESSQ